jgi:N-acetylneuraminic acid mutarotase
MTRLPTLPALALMLSLSPLAPAAELRWTPVRDLPDPVGLKGMIAGVTGDRLLLAGGSSFPVPKSAGGKKAFHRAAWTQPLASAGRAAWTPLGDALPRAMAEGASVTTPHGVVSLGGDGGAGMLRDVLLLAWNPARAALDLRALPALPLTVGSAAAAWHDGKLYVAGGDDGRGGTQLCAALDLAAALRDPAAARWEPLPAWPGPRRFGAALVPLEFGGRTELVLAGGKIGTPGPATQQDYLADAFAFDPVARTWRALPPLPRRALLAVALCIAPGRLLIAGGSDGHDIERLAEIGERYRLPGDAMIFDAATGRWSAAGAMPLGVAGAAVVPLPGGAHLVAGGEYSPALRTPRVFVVEEGAR